MINMIYYNEQNELAVPSLDRTCESANQQGTCMLCSKTVTKSFISCTSKLSNIYTNKLSIISQSDS